jgi:class 3 adenylate cyclase
MGRIRSGNLNAPAEERRLPRMRADLVHVGPLSIGRASLEPGWRWSVDVKPRVGTPYCEIHHLQLVLEGRLAIEMDDGEYGEFGPGELCEVPPGHDAWVVGSDPVLLVDMFGNVAGFGLPTNPERMLATLLMTDIVDSTATAARLGDAIWRQRLAAHNRVVRTMLDEYRGHEVNTTGDGFLATFTSAGAAIRGALALREAVAQVGLAVRVGVHTGEIEVLPNDIGGIAVHAVARLMALGGAGEVIVSDTTRSLLAGAGFRFEDRGEHQLKGLDEPMRAWIAVG